MLSPTNQKSPRALDYNTERGTRFDATSTLIGRGVGESSPITHKQGQIDARFLIGSKRFEELGMGESPKRRMSLQERAAVDVKFLDEKTALLPEKLSAIGQESEADERHRENVKRSELEKQKKEDAAESKRQNDMLWTPTPPLTERPEGSSSSHRSSVSDRGTEQGQRDTERVVGEKERETQRETQMADVSRHWEELLVPKHAESDREIRALSRWLERKLADIHLSSEMKGK